MRLLLTLSILGFLGCADETVTAYGAADKTWRLTELSGQPFSANATLTFPARGKIAGSAPCNRYTADMTVPYPWFETGPIAATRRACPDLDAESLYFDTLRAMTLSEVLGDTLILSTPGGAHMVFTTTGG
ncbi:META domain-containing protein [Sulfitobacter sabulilitoris]|uniref:META domain-containing protein n=1 Tax=Sulfitobacter sabulilitoris TaxID=2562655 RepID=A0A5S3PG09_9RHOB|nr:META domain-containing protein [Sulfitobacter sabulilitoris]TMM52987.1 META domain-containing protein [Sulfitobacter sabulilitoris]